MLFSFFLLFVGHNAPGGGFAGGLVVGPGAAVRYLAGGRVRADEAAPVHAGLVLGAGLFVSLRRTGLLALLFGGEALRMRPLDLDLPLIGDVHLVTSLLFDIGVYLSWSGWCWTSCAASAPRWTGRSRPSGAGNDRPLEADLI